MDQESQTSPRHGRSIVVLVVLVALAAGVLFGVAISDGRNSTAASSPATQPPSSLPTRATGVHTAGLDPHAPTSDEPTGRDLAALDRELLLTKAAALRYPTLGAAKRAGWTLATSYASGIGTHLMDYSRIYAEFDPAKPSMLLYAGDDQTSPVVGVAYYVYSTTRPPEGFPGLLDKWHRHPAVCVDRNGAHLSEAAGIIACGHRGRNAWMLHAWVVPGYESIEGTFSARNLKLP